MNKLAHLLLVICVTFGVGQSPIARAAVGDVGVYVSSSKTFSTASYWIEGTDSVVMVDTQFLPTEGLQALELAEKTTGKKVSTAIVLHPNPDKFNGTDVYQKRGIKVVTSKQVAELIPAVHAIRWEWFGQEYAPHYPRDAAKPDIFGDKTITTTIAGLALTLHVVGQAASGAHVLVQHRDQLFVGDLVNPSNHAWLELGLISDWLNRLEQMRGLLPKTVHPGRGKSGGPELLAQQFNYLKQIKEWIDQEQLGSNPFAELGWFTKWRLQRKIEAAYPHLGYTIFMRDGLEALWKVELKNRHQAVKN